MPRFFNCLWFWFSRRITVIMEKDQNPIPPIKIIDPWELLCGAAHFLFDQFRHVGISEHANRGGGPMLDRMEYEQEQLDFEAQAGIGW